MELKVTRMHGGKPWMTEFDNKFVQAAGRAIEKGFGKAPVFNREGGSIPVVSTFQEVLGLPSVLFGVGLPDENAHAPNEKLDLGNFHDGIIASAYLYDEIAREEPARLTPIARLTLLSTPTSASTWTACSRTSRPRSTPSSRGCFPCGRCCRPASPRTRSSAARTIAPDAKASRRRQPSRDAPAARRDLGRDQAHPDFWTTLEPTVPKAACAASTR